MAMDTPTRDLRGRLIVDEQHHDDVLQRHAATAKVSLWISTANLKELRTEAPIGTRARASGTYVSFVSTLDSLVGRGVDVRILHGALPSRPFGQAFASCTHLKRTALHHCPRVHAKLIVVDGTWLYLGSANFTGAGLGAKNEGRRNFEVGFLTDNDAMLDSAQAYFDRIYRGKACAGCKLRSVCPKPLDGARKKPIARTTRKSLPVAVKGPKGAGGRLTSS